jgi:hypothetical protein
MLLDNAKVLRKQMEYIVCVKALLGEGVERGYLSLPATKVDKKKAHQSISTAGYKRVGGRRRRQWMKRGGGPGGQEAVARGEAEAATQQPVRVDNKRQQQNNRWRRQQTGGGSVTRCDATTSQDG